MIRFLLGKGARVEPEKATDLGPADIAWLGEQDGGAAERYWREVLAGFAAPTPLGVDRAISLPHTLTCYHCHFEPRLEVRFDALRPETHPLPQHRTADCVGLWEVRWLADDPFLICDRCLAGSPATPAARAAAEAENDRAMLLARLAREGKRMM